MKENQLINFFKGYSIFTIVAYHFMLNLNLNGLMSKAIMFGGTGVHLFIFISGYGLYSSYLKKPITFFPFIAKRFTKIYFPYILVVLFSFVVALFVPVYPISAYAIFGHIFLFKMFDSTIIESYGGQFWFISTIIQFYISFHLILLFKKRVKDKYFLLFGIVISLLWGLIVVFLNKTQDRAWNGFYLQYIWEFILGMLVAERGVHFLNIKFNKNLYLLLGIILLGVFGFLALKGGSPGKVFNDIPGFLSYTFLATFLYKLNIKPINNFFFFTARISFSLYLWHILIILSLKYFLNYYNLNFSVWYFLLFLPFSYIVSYAFNECFLSRLYKTFGLSGLKQVQLNKDSSQS